MTGDTIEIEDNDDLESKESTYASSVSTVSTKIKKTDELSIYEQIAKMRKENIEGQRELKEELIKLRKKKEIDAEKRLISFRIEEQM
jgi:hypothetical protein